MNSMEKNTLITPLQLAERLSISVETLNTWRATNRYPLPYVKAGRLVRYRECDVQQFIESRMVGSPP